MGRCLANTAHSYSTSHIIYAPASFPHNELPNGYILYTVRKARSNYQENLEMTFIPLLLSVIPI
jgi:hypothetical protein